MHEVIGSSPTVPTKFFTIYCVKHSTPYNLRSFVDHELLSFCFDTNSDTKTIPVHGYRFFFPLEWKKGVLSHCRPRQLFQTGSIRSPSASACNLTSLPIVPDRTDCPSRQQMDRRGCPVRHLSSFSFAPFLARGSLAERTKNKFWHRPAWILRSPIPDNPDDAAPSLPRRRRTRLPFLTGIAQTA